MQRWAPMRSKMGLAAGVAEVRSSSWATEVRHRRALLAGAQERESLKGRITQRSNHDRASEQTARSSWAG